MLVHFALLVCTLFGASSAESFKQVLTSNVSSTTISTVQLSKLCDVCSCSESQVDCSNRNLTTTFEISQWPKIEVTTITFQGNQLVHLTIFPDITVDKLIFKENQITKIDDLTFVNLKNLTELDLSYNNLTYELLSPHAFQGHFSPILYEPLDKLTVLNLGHNQLHKLHQDLFEHLTNLKVLSLDGNPFSVIDQSTTLAISSIPYLEELDLSYCNLKSISDHLFHSPKHLKLIHLQGNKLKTPPAALEDAKSLEYLCLNDNPIEIIDDDNGFPEMPQLKELSICHMSRLTRIGSGAFGKLPMLENLRLENCPQLSEIDEDAFINKSFEGAIWPPLRKLEIANNALRYLPANLVGRWDKLEKLSLTNNAWSCDCENQFMIGSLLPNLAPQLMGKEVETLSCSSPPEHKGKNLTSLVHRHLRCLDLYNARPEKDATILIGILIGVLLAVPVSLALFVFWRKGFFFCGTQGPATYSRAFYKRADKDDDF
ncbi:leucine-rich repeat neuronal protein 3 [Orussus abietinus]|uniref:leucine-rich repeat neuronal protein 3 n=1 Tax=Orussus abietinus TaxID=222816 RepID=UPI0006269284|nr:leucine-rich repeat neuronal protein 3 [Orussus abietinus]